MQNGIWQCARNWNKWERSCSFLFLFFFFLFASLALGLSLFLCLSPYLVFSLGIDPFHKKRKEKEKKDNNGMHFTIHTDRMGMSMIHKRFTYCACTGGAFLPPPSPRPPYSSSISWGEDGGKFTQNLNKFRSTAVMGILINLNGSFSFNVHRLPVTSRLPRSVIGHFPRSYPPINGRQSGLIVVSGTFCKIIHSRNDTSARSSRGKFSNQMQLQMCHWSAGVLTQCSDLAEGKLAKRGSIWTHSSLFIFIFFLFLLRNMICLRVLIINAW